MNNIPGDIVRAMGAEHVIAVNVGNLNDKTEINYSLLGLVMETLDAMMRANTIKALRRGADIMINVPVEEFGSLDWRRAPQLIAAGYQGAELMKDALLPLAVSEAEWQQWRDKRQAARLPDAAVAGVRPRRRRRRRATPSACRRRCSLHVGQPLDLDALVDTMHELGGLDRYETLSWSIVEQNGADGLLVTARPKNYGPPFMYLGISLENTTGNEFRFGLAGRYLAFDVFGSGSETRIDASIGSDPSFAATWYRPLGSSRMFIEPGAGVTSQSLSAIADGHTFALYTRTRAGFAIDGGVNAGRDDEVRAGLRYGWSNANISVGDPGLPELEGEDSFVHHAVDARRAGRRGRAVARAAFSGVAAALLQRPRPQRGGGRRSDDRGRDAVPGRGILAQVARSRPAPPPVHERRHRHVVRRRTVSDGAVRARRADADERVQRRRAARRSFRARLLRIFSPADAAA